MVSSLGSGITYRGASLVYTFTLLLLFTSFYYIVILQEEKGRPSKCALRFFRAYEGLMAEKVNYTNEMVEQLIALYEELGNDGLDEIAERMSKPVRSVRSKLVQEGVYKASPKTAASKLNGPSKKEILRDIEKTGFSVEGLDAATKSALLRILEHVKDS